MSKKIDEMRRTATDKSEPKVADTKVATPEEDWLTKMLEDLKDTKKELDKIDPKLLKEVQDKLCKEVENHQKTLDDHESRIAKLEKATAASATVVASTAAPVVTAVGASAPAAVGVSDYDRIYPTAPVPHHVVKAYHIRLGSGVEILRYYEADAICIANTEEPGVSHTAVCIYAWSDKDGLLIRPLTADESYRFRKL